MLGIAAVSALRSRAAHLLYAPSTQVGEVHGFAVFGERLARQIESHFHLVAHFELVEETAFILSELKFGVLGIIAVGDLQYKFSFPEFLTYLVFSEDLV